MPVEDLARVLTAWRDRMADLKRDGRMRAALVFKNEGVKAGARLAHPHSQLVTMPVVPPELAEELAGADRYHEVFGRCVYCALADRETAAGARVVASSDDALVIAPYAARWPFELWLLPRVHQARFEQAPGSLLAAVAAVLQPVLQDDRAAARAPGAERGAAHGADRRRRRGDLSLAPGDRPAGAAARRDSSWAAAPQ